MAECDEVAMGTMLEIGALSECAMWIVFSVGSEDFVNQRGEQLIEVIFVLCTVIFYFCFLAVVWWGEFDDATGRCCAFCTIHECGNDG